MGSFSDLKTAMSSTTITLNGNSSELSAFFFPAIELDQPYEFSCGLLDFTTYHSIPNVNETNNTFTFWKNDQNITVIDIPNGSYEIEDIVKYLNEEMSKRGHTLDMKLNKNTIKVTFKSDVKVDFDFPKSIGRVLGFSKTCNANILWESTDPIRVTDLNVMRIECDLVGGTYINGKPSHTIHQFTPNVSPGYKIVEVPRNIIYLPVVKREISSIHLKFVDQSGNPIDFRGETVTCRLHIKRDA